MTNNLTLKTALSALALTALLASMPLASANLNVGKVDLKDITLPGTTGCHEGEPVADCAIRVTYEFAWAVVGPIYTAAEDYCDDLTSVCPLLVQFDSQASFAAARIDILGILAKDGCHEGEPVADCAARVTYEFVWAIVGPAVTAVIEYCKDLTSICNFKLESSSSASINLLDIIQKSGCHEGEPVIDCAYRVTYEFVWAVVGPIVVATIKLCRDLTSACPYITIRNPN